MSCGRIYFLEFGPIEFREQKFHQRVITKIIFVMWKYFILNLYTIDGGYIHLEALHLVHGLHSSLRYFAFSFLLTRIFAAEGLLPKEYDVKRGPINPSTSFTSR